MLFLSPAETRKKHKLFQRSQRGTLTTEQFLLRVLEIDPFDSIALAGLGGESVTKADMEAARRYFWRALDAEPANGQMYLHLTASLTESDPELAASVGYLALRRILRNPRRLDTETEEWLALVRADME